jgi:hypothetical protein
MLPQPHEINPITLENECTQLTMYVIEIQSMTRQMAAVQQLMRARRRRPHRFTRGMAMIVMRRFTPPAPILAYWLPSLLKPALSKMVTE